MVKVFIPFSVDVDRTTIKRNLLGHAAAEGNIDVVDILTEAGASSFLSIRAFLKWGNSLSDVIFQQVLQ